MEYVFDELKQFMTKEITEYTINQYYMYPNLVKGKKYLIVYYSEKNQEQITTIEYAGKFNFIDDVNNGPYADFEGIYFNGINNECKNELTLSFRIIDNIYCSNTNDNTTYKFFELEHDFNKKNILDIFNYIILNNNLNGMPNDIEIYIDEISMRIF